MWTCRAGFEPYLFEELAWAGARPELLGPALVESGPVRSPPAFARAGFTAGAALDPANAERIAQALLAAAQGHAMHLQFWTPDTPRANALSARADAVAAAVAERIPGLLTTAQSAREQNAMLGQMCMVEETLLLAGAEPARAALSLAPGGRMRMWREDAPSRAAMKLEEALAIYSLAPSRGEVCADLGAAPGGWTQRLVARGARVIAVDPASLAPDLVSNPRVQHVRTSAFAFAPEEPVDWLFCDIAWRPLEVAQLLAKWGRHGWALHLCANLKLPMKDKNQIVYKVRHLLADDGGWLHLQVRQLYHDRDEVTLLGRRV